MTVFLSVGALILLFTIIVNSCDEGGCGCYKMCHGCCRIWCLCVTCCCCDIGKPREDTEQQGLTQMPSENRRQWVNMGKTVLGFTGIGAPQNIPNHPLPMPPANQGGMYPAFPQGQGY
eukprot:TRINITY_DN0_c3873_g1_i1.p1 TRINITY_DN0_c3873_g1~~TRINITY_DN0_c3873_g1_i1.p1  ORF type:complete len:118 (+),score=13.94 TRINITY_DN0_c3873_g1_i1:3-356(+)